MPAQEKAGAALLSLAWQDTALRATTAADLDLTRAGSETARQTLVAKELA